LGLRLFLSLLIAEGGEREITSPDPRKVALSRSRGMPYPAIGQILAGRNYKERNTQ
jgi:hypothetical protein